MSIFPKEKHGCFPFTPSLDPNSTSIILARLRSIKDDKTTETEDMAIAPPDTKGGQRLPGERKEEAGGQRNANAVVAQGKEEIELNTYGAR